MSSKKEIFLAPDQFGRTVIITGANSGLGYELAREFVKKNAKVIMACRSEAKGQLAMQDILSEFPGGSLRVEVLDVSSLNSVRAFAERMLAKLDRLDLLINNAGVMAIPKQKSVDGFEMQFATNHLGHFLLTGLLLPKLLETEGSRVIPVSSLAARLGKINMDDPMGEKSYDQWKVYYQSKLANLMFGLELQRRLARNRATTTAVVAHPGLSSTSLYSTRGGGLIKRIVMPLTRAFLFHSAASGAQSILYAAVAQNAKPGGYYGPANSDEKKGPPKEAFVPVAAKDELLAERLWELSEKLTDFSYLNEA